MAKVQIGESLDFEKLLSRFDVQNRGRVLKNSLNAGGRVVRNEYRRTVSVGDPNHKPDKPSLKESIDQKLWHKGTFYGVVVGGKWPDGAHAHLVEDGHKVRARGPAGGGNPGEWTGARVEGKQQLAKAIESTKTAAETAVETTLAKEFEKLSK
jgi:hypothetical protein